MDRSTFWQPGAARRIRLSVTSSAVLLFTVLPMAGSAQAASAPATVTVKAGDTLWGLSRQLMGDPFLWPAIYRLNTQLVADPHWIYPGQVLRLAGGEAVTAVPTVDTPLPATVPESVMPAAEPARARIVAAPAETDSVDMTALFSQTRRNELMRETLRAYSEQPYRPLRRSEFFSSGFLTEGRDLPFGHLTGLVTPPQIGVISSQVTPLLFSEVTVVPPSGGTYQVGDSLLSVVMGEEVEGLGRVVMPTGMVRITDVSKGQYVGSVIALYGAIESGQRLMPAEHFNDAGSARAVPVADGVTGRLVASTNPRSLKKPQDVLFLDKGAKDGVAPGDVFEVRRGSMRNGSRTVPEVMATVQVVHVNDHSSTTRILTIISPDLPMGSEVRQIAKLPS